MISLTVNGELRSIDVEQEKPLLWVLREDLGLNGTKYGCGIAACGACTVLVDGVAMRACAVNIGALAGKRVTTIEGLADGSKLHRIQAAWISAQVPQCGYCQSGMIMATAALLESNPHPTDEDIDQTLTNICRCGTYPRIREAIQLAIKS